MKNNGRFMVGLVGVAAVVTYLIWTGVSETMVYYVTPVELLERVEADPSFHDVGVKVGGMVVPGSYSRVEGELLHVFTVRDLEDESTTFRVEFRDALPDTFTDKIEVVMGTGVFLDGTRRRTVVSNASGHARVEYTTGASAGPLSISII